MWRWPRGGPIGRPAKACAVVASPRDRPVSRAVASGAGRSGVRATVPREASPEQTAVRRECSDAARSAERQDRLPPTQTRAPRGSRRGCGRDIVRGGEGGLGGCSRGRLLWACSTEPSPERCHPCLPLGLPPGLLPSLPPRSAPGPAPRSGCLQCHPCPQARDRAASAWGAWGVSTRQRCGGRTWGVGKTPSRDCAAGRPVPWSLPSSRKAGRRVSCPSQCRLHRSAGKS